MGFIDKLDDKLKGAPEALLTAGLILAGIFAWLIAIFGSPTMKATTLAWFIAP